MNNPYEPPQEIDDTQRPRRRHFGWGSIVAALVVGAIALYLSRIGAGPSEVLVVLLVGGMLFIPTWWTK